LKLVPKINQPALLRWLIAVGLGVVGTIQYHAAQFTSRFDIFFGDRGDARGFVYFCEHWYQALCGKTNLMSPAIFYPTTGTLAYSDLLFGFAIPYSVVRALGANMFSAVEVVVISLTLATYLATFLLLNRVLRFDLVPSIVGAMFFAFSSPKFFQTGHIQLQFIIGLPLIFIFLILFYQRAAQLSQWRATLYLSAAGICLLLQLTTTFYYAWYFVLWSFLFFAVVLLLPASRKSVFALLRRFWLAIAASAAVFLAGFFPFLLIYARTIRVGEWYSYKNVSEMIPQWWAFLSMGDGNYIWGWLAARVRPEPWPATWGEQMIGIGLVPSITLLLLLVFAFYIAKVQFFTRRGAVASRFNPPLRSPAHAFFAAMIVATIIFYVLGIKYRQDSSPWIYVYTYFPGARAVRAMSRFPIMLTLPISIGIAYVTNVALRQALNQRSYQRRIAMSIVIAVVAAFAVVEQFGRFKVGGTGFSKKAEAAYVNAMAAKLPRDCEAFYVAPGTGKHNPFEYQYDAMLISIVSGIPTINASSSQFPLQWHTLYDVKDPQYETHVQSWIALHNLRGKICRLEIGPQIEGFDVHAPSPLDDPTFFVRQQFRDLAGRDPETNELAAYVGKLQNCKMSRACDRTAVAVELFQHTGFDEDGSFVYRLHQVAYGRAPAYLEFGADLSAYREGGRNKLALAEGIANRPDFVSQYSALPMDQYASKLSENAEGAMTGDVRQALSSSQESRAQILLRVADDANVARAFRNRAFVALQYFGYLHRDPEHPGFDLWLRLLDETGDTARVTASFVNSIEYRQRFF
jgi:hypothetical protein